MWGGSEMQGIKAPDHMVFARFSKPGKANWLGKITTGLLPFCDKDTSCGRSTNPSSVAFAPHKRGYKFSKEDFFLRCASVMCFWGDETRLDGAPA